MIIKDEDHLIFETTGHVLHANCGVIGINPDLELSEGYDGHLCPHNAKTGHEIWKEDLTEPVFTREEKKELAHFMISLWEKWRDRS